MRNYNSYDEDEAYRHGRSGYRDNYRDRNAERDTPDRAYYDGLRDYRDAKERREQQEEQELNDEYYYRQQEEEEENLRQQEEQFGYVPHHIQDDLPF